MEKLDNLRQWLTDRGVLLFDRQLPFSNDESKAVTIKLNDSDTWGIFMDSGRMKTTAEEKSALLHEGGHYSTGTTHQVFSPCDLISRHEHKANKWAIRRALSAEELNEAVAAGNTEVWQLADYFGITEDLMKKAVCWYAHGNLATELYF